MYDIGLVVDSTLPFALDVVPTIFSPLEKVPVILDIVIDGAEASALVSSESYTACNLYTSARPNDISLSLALTPYAPSASLATTFTCFKRLVVSDNVLWSGKVLEENSQDEETEMLKKFNSMLKKDKRITNLIVPLRDGLSISQVN